MKTKTKNKIDNLLTHCYITVHEAESDFKNKIQIQVEFLDGPFEPIQDVVLEIKDKIDIECVVQRAQSMGLMDMDRELIK